MAQELRSFVTKFESLMQAGTDARLSMEYHAGQVRIKFEVNLNKQPPPLQPQYPPHRPSPSRLRRRARRAEARAHACTAEQAAAGAPLTAEIAVQTEAPPANSEAAGNAAPIPEPLCPPSTAEAAVQVEILLPAVQAGCPGPGHVPLLARLDDHDCPQPPHHDVTDVLCPDSQFRSGQERRERDRDRERQEDMDNFMALIQNKLSTTRS